MAYFTLPGIRRSNDPGIDDFLHLFEAYKKGKRQAPQEQQPAMQQAAAPQAPQAPQAQQPATQQAAAPQAPQAPQAQQQEPLRPTYNAPGQDVDSFVKKRTVTRADLEGGPKVVARTDAKLEGPSPEAQEKIAQLDRYYNNKLAKLDADYGMNAMSEEQYNSRKAQLEAEREKQKSDINRLYPAKEVHKRTVVNANGIMNVGPQENGVGSEPGVETTYVGLDEDEVYNKATGETQTVGEAEKWGYDRVREINDRAGRQVYAEDSQSARDARADQRAAENPYGLPSVPMPENGEDPAVYAGRMEQWKQNVRMMMDDAASAREIQEVAAKALAEVAKLKQTGMNDANVENIRANARRDVAKMAADARLGVADRQLQADKYKADKTAAKPTATPQQKALEGMRGDYAKYLQKWRTAPKVSTHPDLYTEADVALERMKKSLADAKRNGMNPSHIIDYFKAKYPHYNEMIDAFVSDNPDLADGEELSFEDWVVQTGRAKAYGLTEQDVRSGGAAPEPEGSLFDEMDGDPMMTGDDTDLGEGAAVGQVMPEDEISPDDQLLLDELDQILGDYEDAEDLLR